MKCMQARKKYPRSRSGRCLYLYFGSEHHGEVLIKVKDPEEGLTMTKARAIAKQVMAEYTSTKGVRLTGLRRAKLIRREESLLK